MRVIFILLSIILFVVPAQAAVDYNYYLGPWVWYDDDPEDPNNTYWKAPDGTVGVIDFRSIPEHAYDPVPKGYGFFAVDGTLPAPYMLLGSGDIRTIVPTLAARKNIKDSLGHNPTGTTLKDIVVELLTTGSDPKGLTASKPLMPNKDSKLEVYLGGHSKIHSENFDINTHHHAAKVIEVERDGYRAQREKTVEGRSQTNFHRRFLDKLGEKYRVDRPQDFFIPDDLPRETPLPHRTTLTEDFNKADSDILGPDQTWTEYVNDQDVDTNRYEAQGTSFDEHVARAEADVSSSDHESYVTGVDIDAGGAGDRSQPGPTCRMDENDAASYNFYYAHYQDHESGPVRQRRLFKMVSGSKTQLADTAHTRPSQPFTIGTKCDGSTISSRIEDTYYDDVTDTAITGNTRGGIRYYQTSMRGNLDDWGIEDLAAASAVSRAQVIMS